jgi:hypothetical protein
VLAVVVVVGTVDVVLTVAISAMLSLLAMYQFCNTNSNRNDKAIFDVTIPLMTINVNILSTYSNSGANSNAVNVADKNSNNNAIIMSNASITMLLQLMLIAMMLILLIKTVITMLLL